VVTFLCDLQSSAWSSEFMSSADGKTFIRRVVNNLMPVSRIQVQNISYTLKEDNYTNQLYVFTDLDLTKGQSVQGTLTNVETGEVTPLSLNAVTEGTAEELREMDCYVTMNLSELNGYGRCDFIVRKSGVYVITLEKYENGQPIPDTKLTFYKSFAYSEEYDTCNVPTEAELQELATSIAARGNGAVIENLENPWEVFHGFITLLPQTFDPRYAFMITAIVLFLLDIAVRKFKFKWPHELIRDYKAKKNSTK